MGREVPISGRIYTKNLPTNIKKRPNSHWNNLNNIRLIEGRSARPSSV